MNDEPSVTFRGLPWLQLLLPQARATGKKEGPFLAERPLVVFETGG